DALTRHAEFNEIFNVTLTAHERGRVKIDNPSLNNFLPKGARFVPTSALRHYHHRYSLFCATTRGSQRSEIVPAVNCDYVRVCLLQRGPKRSVKLSPSGILVCRFRE